MVQEPGAGDRSPHYVDQHVGRRIRELRKRLGVSQERLADTLGLTFQQVQKYEKGANRVSASKLFDIAAALQTEIGYFFQGLPQPEVAGAGGVAEGGGAFVYDAPLTAEGAEIDRLIAPLKARKRRLVLDMARALAEAPDKVSQDA